MIKYLNQLYELQCLQNRLMNICDERLSIMQELDGLNQMEQGMDRDKQHRDLMARADKVNEEHQILNEKAKGQSFAKIPANVIMEFFALIKGYPISVLAMAVNNETCGECGHVVPKEDVVLLCCNKRIVKCTECGRILVSEQRLQVES